MKLPFSEPVPSGTRRASAAKHFRDLSTNVSRERPQALTKSNAEEDDHGPVYPANFTKGLAHDAFGLLNAADYPEDYPCFVMAINSEDRSLFDDKVKSAKDRGVIYTCVVDAMGKKAEWRGWESPRAGHVFELEGPDAGSVGMSPAPRVGSSELAAEIAEVYALAILRDVPFTEIVQGNGGKIGGGNAERTAAQLAALLDAMPFFNGPVANRTSSTPGHADPVTGLNQFEGSRRAARLRDGQPALTADVMFRGSTAGAKAGPFVSQFLLAGANSVVPTPTGNPGFPGKKSQFEAEDGFIRYGTQIIDQRIIVHKAGLDHMTDWRQWLDVQNGAKYGGTDAFESTRRFITTPRDLATYVHYDQLYQAYLNAAFLLLDAGTPHSRGFPEPSISGRRDAFATFGGPHILSLVTEVATRCLKAVRRQKFNYHRRARPEALAGRLTLVELGEAARLGNAQAAFMATHAELPMDLRDAIKAHNTAQNGAAMVAMRKIECGSANGNHPDGITAALFNGGNLLLPMAFPEGSPMHPSYGAGHATVAGGCVTILKAFFEMFESGNSYKERILKMGDSDYFEPDSDGSKLVNKNGTKLTVQGELDKLAANIAIGRDMAGVHYYSDYYDSLRLGERIAVGIMMEQCPAYGDSIESVFNSFDGDRLTIYGETASAPSLSVITKDGIPISEDAWWLRHVTGRDSSAEI